MMRLEITAILLTAAILEAGGDALIRFGLHRQLLWQRTLLFALAALVLLLYGWVLNAPPWDFGSVIGLYIVFFFLIAQLFSCFLFKQMPSRTLVIGGLLIVAGGALIATNNLG